VALRKNSRSSLNTALSEVRAGRDRRRGGVAQRVPAVRGGSPLTGTAEPKQVFRSRAKRSTGVFRDPAHQCFQGESGLHQNWMRDYDPVTGSYLQPDPLGLVGGAED